VNDGRCGLEGCPPPSILLEVKIIWEEKLGTLFTFPYPSLFDIKELGLLDLVVFLLCVICFCNMIYVSWR